MIISGILDQISASWIAIRVNGATQPIRVPINDDQAREIAGALGREIIISIQAATEALPEIGDAPAIPFSAVRPHARMLAETAASLDVKAAARLIESLAIAVTATVDALSTETAERRHDQANAATVTTATNDLLQATRSDVASLIATTAIFPAGFESSSAEEPTAVIEPSIASEPAIEVGGEIIDASDPTVPDGPQSRRRKR